MNSSSEPVLAVAIVVLSAAVVDSAMVDGARAQTQRPPEPGAAATPGTTAPDRSDPATATPGLVTHPAEGANPSPHADEHDRTQSSRARQQPQVGTAVQTRNGELLGSVESIVTDTSGSAAYVVVASSSGARTAIPYPTALALLHDGHIVVSRPRLEGSPLVRADEVRDRTNVTWRAKTDRYWNASASGASHSGRPEYQR